jgi:iron complex outermembrane receptor protein
MVVFSRAEDMNNFLNHYQTSQGYKYVPYNVPERNPSEAFKYNIRGGDIMDLLWNALRNSEDENQDRVLSSVTLNYKINNEFGLRGRVGNDFTSLGTEVKKYNEFPALFNSGNSTGEYRVASGRYFNRVWRCDVDLC